MTEPNLQSQNQNTATSQILTSDRSCILAHVRTCTGQLRNKIGEKKEEVTACVLSKDGHERITETHIKIQLVKLNYCMEFVGLIRSREIIKSWIHPIPAT